MKTQCVTLDRNRVLEYLSIYFIEFFEDGALRGGQKEKGRPFSLKVLGASIVKKFRGNSYSQSFV